jgi:transcriptional regulator with XRE-family HTH domain
VPLADRLRGSLHNTKELRPGSAGSTEVRILFCFDPRRQAVLLVAGDKSGQWQEDVAAQMHVSQSRVSRIERGDLDHVEVATLRSYVEALGGRVEIIANFGDERIVVAQSSAPALAARGVMHQVRRPDLRDFCGAGINAWRPPLQRRSRLAAARQVAAESGGAGLPPATPHLELASGSELTRPGTLLLQVLRTGAKEKAPAGAGASAPKHGGSGQPA